jgi:hypothetical protein
LEKHAPTAIEELALHLREIVEILAEHFDTTGPFGQEPQDRAGQNRLAGARTAYEAEHFTAKNIEIESIENISLAEADDEVAHGDRDFAVTGGSLRSNGRRGW